MFVDSYWEKIKRDFEYQLEEILKLTSYLEHVQAVFQKFDPTVTPNKETLIQYFRKGLKPSSWAQLDARGRELDSWEVAVEKAVNAEAKILLQPRCGSREIDSRCFGGNRLTKKEKKDLERLSPLTLVPLTFLVASINPPPTKARLARRTRITRDIFGTEGAKGVVTMTPLQLVLTPTLSKRKRRTSPKLSAISAIKKGITRTSILSIQKMSQNTSVNLSNFYAGDWN